MLLELLQSRKEFKNKIADRVVQISKNLINEDENEMFGEEKDGNAKKGHKKKHLMKDLSEEVRR